LHQLRIKGRSWLWNINIDERLPLTAGFVL